MKKPKVLIVIKNIDGGTGTFLFQILKLTKFFDIKICALERRRFGSSEFYSNINYFTNHTSHISKYTLNPFLYISIIKEILWLGKSMSREKPDVIISIDTHCNILAHAARNYYAKQSRIIITTHNNLSEVAKRKAFLIKELLKIIGRYLFDKSDLIICVSEGVKEDFGKFFSIKKYIKVIPYGLDCNNIDKLSKEAIFSDTKSIFSSGKVKRVISIGRFEEQKDFVTLIKAFARVIDEVGGSELILMGDGSQKDMLKKLVNSLKIEKYVHFIGWQANVFPYLKKCDIFVLSSNYEGFGYVLLEAMSQGLPVISTDSPYGPSEVLGNGKYGLLVPVGNINSMKNAISRLMDNKSQAKKYSEKSRERIKHYTEDNMLASYRKILNSIIT